MGNKVVQEEVLREAPGHHLPRLQTCCVFLVLLSRGEAVPIPQKQKPLHLESEFLALHDVVPSPEALMLGVQCLVLSELPLLL